MRTFIAHATCTYLIPKDGKVKEIRSEPELIFRGTDRRMLHSMIDEALDMPGAEVIIKEE